MHYGEYLVTDVYCIICF